MNKALDGWTSGFVGMLMFSGSLPATRMAVLGFDPVFVTLARASIAGLLGVAMLWILGAPRPTRDDWASLAIVAMGGVVGFPLLTALALRQITSAQSMIFVGLLPVLTAGFGVLRAGERPRLLFWVFSGLGASLVVGFSLHRSVGTSIAGSLLMLAAVALAGLGYAEGAKLSRRLGGWQVISWALVVALPLMLPLTFVRLPSTLQHVPIGSWVGLGYVSVFSMLIGFVFWYRGLALGGIAAVSQLQLLQPFCGLMLSAGLLHETVRPALVVVMVAAACCAYGAKQFATWAVAPAEPVKLRIEAPG